MINRAEFERAKEKWQLELNKATQELQSKTAAVEKAERDVPTLRREIMDLQTAIAGKKELMLEAERTIQRIKPELPRLAMEMKKMHHELEAVTRDQAMTLKDTGVSGIRHKF